MLFEMDCGIVNKTDTEMHFRFDSELHGTPCSELRSGRKGYILVELERMKK